MLDINVRPINIEDEMRTSYLDYAMSVIVDRALPDVRDGNKPVHRRVLYAMHELGNDFNKPFKKSARVVGDVIGKYHPHGDSAVYETMVRLAQPFSMRYMLVDGQGNFGSVDGDPAAAMRYTEVRMQRMANDMMADLDKETVDWVPNYDGTELVPTVLPTRVPNLLINGSSGIAVGMATNIPPHNLTEIITGCLALIDDPEIGVEGLMRYIPGPDFPTGGIIHGRQGIHDAYATGRGKLLVRGKATVEVNGKKEVIIISELPYMVNKAKLLERIADMVRDKKLEGISAMRDESDKDGMRMVIEIKRGESGEVVLNNLYKETSLQTTFGINMNALVQGQPTTMGIKRILEEFLLFRREIVTRRSVYELRKARERAHVLEGLMVALENVEAVIETIRACQTADEAAIALRTRNWNASQLKAMLGTDLTMARPDKCPQLWTDDGLEYILTDVQVREILGMRLQRLTGLECGKIEVEYNELLVNIKELLEIIIDRRVDLEGNPIPSKLMQVVRAELEEARAQYGDARRTEINMVGGDLQIEDLINKEDVIVTLSHGGYVKYQPTTAYNAQKRGGMGKSATRLKDEDFIEKVIVANTHDTLLCFSTIGKVYWLKVYALPEATREARGRPIVNLLPLAEGERITTMLPISEFTDDHYVFFATALGTVKKTQLSSFKRPLAAGIRAITMRGDDALVGVDITDGTNEVMLFTNTGRVVRFSEGAGNPEEPEDSEVEGEEVRSFKGVRPMGRGAAGVRGIRMPAEGRVVSLVIPRGDGPILTATQNGYGKRTELAEYPTKSRATQGVLSIKVSERNGYVVDAVQVNEEDDLVLITNAATMIRFHAKDVALIGRNTNGVKLMKPALGELVTGVSRIVDDNA